MSLNSRHVRDELVYIFHILGCTIINAEKRNEAKVVVKQAKQEWQEELGQKNFSTLENALKGLEVWLSRNIIKQQQRNT